MTAPKAEPSTPPGKRIGVSVIGSTGSIGTQTLEVIESHPDRFTVVALAAKNRIDLLFEQVKRHQPDLVVTGTTPERKATLIPPSRLAVGEEGLVAAATHPEADIVVLASSGHVGIRPALEAIRSRKTIALANKEALVCAGELIIPMARRHGVEIRPVDSEHSAIWQCLCSAPVESIRRLILTASGGPFRDVPLGKLESVTARDALRHPTWKMGKKITIDSATMVNKGLELIEARWLFNVNSERIDVLVHAESIVHSIVEFVDGSQLAQMSWPDMRLPIQLALTYPERIAGPCQPLDLAKAGSLTFEPLDLRRFPAFGLSREAARLGGSYPTALSAADEIAVEAFVEGSIAFLDIVRVIEMTLNDHEPTQIDSIDSVLEADRVSRQFARAAVLKVANRAPGR
jgi:1-deoxy-D-xylulose-5-phosphate reductoisomerase